MSIAVLFVLFLIAVFGLVLAIAMLRSQSGSEGQNDTTRIGNGYGYWE